MNRRLAIIVLSFFILLLLTETTETLFLEQVFYSTSSCYIDIYRESVPLFSDVDYTDFVMLESCEEINGFLCRDESTVDWMSECSYDDDYNNDDEGSTLGSNRQGCSCENEMDFAIDDCYESEDERYFTYGGCYDSDSDMSFSTWLAYAALIGGGIVGGIVMLLVTGFLVILVLTCVPRMIRKWNGRFTRRIREGVGGGGSVIRKKDDDAEDFPEVPKENEKDKWKLNVEMNRRHGNEDDNGYSEAYRNYEPPNQVYDNNNNNDNQQQQTTSNSQILDFQMGDNNNMNVDNNQDVNVNNPNYNMIASAPPMMMNQQIPMNNQQMKNLKEDDSVMVYNNQ